MYSQSGVGKYNRREWVQKKHFLGFDVHVYFGLFSGSGDPLQTLDVVFSPQFDPVVCSVTMPLHLRSQFGSTLPGCVHPPFCGDVLVSVQSSFSGTYKNAVSRIPFGTHFDGGAGGLGGPHAEVGEGGGLKTRGAGREASSLPGGPGTENVKHNEAVSPTFGLGGCVK